MAEPDTTEATAESATDESMETTSSDADSDSHAVSNSETSDIIQDASFPTLIEPNGYSASTCGYCSTGNRDTSPRSSRSYGMTSVQMAPRIYQDLIDRGWRRSGTYVYHPDMANTCCPQYTIRLDALQFDPGKDKKMRYLINRWKRYIVEGVKPGETIATEEKIEGKEKGGKKNRNKQSKTQGYDYIQELRSAEYDQATATGVQPALRYEVMLVPAAVTQERFALYKRYQETIHHDRPGKNHISGFNRFLCKNPLGRQRIPYPNPKDVPSILPRHFGCFHQLHRVDGRLVAFSVLDILPGCVSSVYFVWDPDFAWASLGKLSALREAALAREFYNAGMTGMSWLYMGYYIRTCQKMRYKGDYSPSQLLDPGTNTFYPLQDAVKVIDKRPRGYTPLDTNPDTLQIPGSLEDPEIAANEKSERWPRRETLEVWPDPPPPSFMDPHRIPVDYLEKLLVFVKGSLSLLKFIPFMNRTAVHKIVAELVAALGTGRLATLDEPETEVYLAL
ncbi:hypothetical protein NliqN6_0571 [Naganishia liquefaciens]|uniref:arginyltransferase n=1 Tax=Naganishia liquefaciens TaxID=104408 RepID=A0A8H3TPX7_9TREE|nr:hypothetical protein NliqN6_0571 [Naganishia liquefaciens]